MQAEIGMSMNMNMGMEQVEPELCHDCETNTAAGDLEQFWPGEGLCTVCLEVKAQDLRAEERGDMGRDA